MHLTSTVLVQTLYVHREERLYCHRSKLPSHLDRMPIHPLCIPTAVLLLLGVCNPGSAICCATANTLAALSPASCTLIPTMRLASSLCASPTSRLLSLSSLLATRFTYPSCIVHPILKPFHLPTPLDQSRRRCINRGKMWALDIARQHAQHLQNLSSLVPHSFPAKLRVRQQRKQHPQICMSQRLHGLVFGGKIEKVA